MPTQRLNTGTQTSNRIGLPCAYMHTWNTRKLCHRKDDRAMSPIYGCMENFRDSLTTPTATFPKIFHGRLFRSTLWMYVQNLKPVALPVPEIIGGTQKIGQFLDTPTLPSIQTIPVCTGFPAIFDWSFGWGVANLQSWEAYRKSGMVPSETALVSSYRPSRTLPLSLRVQRYWQTDGLS